MTQPVLNRRSFTAGLGALAAASVFGFAGCSSDQSAPAGSTAGSASSGASYKIGVLQLTEHAALDSSNEGFVAALQGYREARQSLSDQVEATREVLEAAKLASVRKATDANTKARADKPVPTQKPAVSSAPAPGPASGTDIDEDEPSPNVPRVQPQGVGEVADLFG